MDGKWYMISAGPAGVVVALAEEEDFQLSLAGYSPFPGEEVYRDVPGGIETPNVIVGRDRESGAITVFLRAADPA